MARDLELTNYDTLIESIYKSDDHSQERELEEDHPSSPKEIPLSQRGCLFLFAAYIFSSVYFGSNIPQPDLLIFPDHARLVHQFLGATLPSGESNNEGVVDAVIMVGIWLEEHNRFVGGPLEDEEFLQLLQTLSLLSANNPSATIRNAAHMLTSLILHAHPSDQVRLAFIADTLEHCPFEALKGCAVSWLKEEIVVSEERKSENLFSNTVALSAVQPYLFPDNSPLAELKDIELFKELGQMYPFHITVVNFILFLAGSKYSHVVPTSMFTIVEEIYLSPLLAAVKRVINSAKDADEQAGEQDVELLLLAHRSELSLEMMKDI